MNDPWQVHTLLPRLGAMGGAALGSGLGGVGGAAGMGDTAGRETRRGRLVIRGAARQGRRVLAGPELGHEVLTDREALRDGVRGRSASLAQPSLTPAVNQGNGAANAPTIRECVEGRDQADMALRMMQLQVKISGGSVAGDARTSAGTLLCARPWRELLEKPPLTGSSSASSGK